MSIFWFIIGLIIGFGFKFAADEYHHYQQNQENNIAKADALYVKLQAMAIAKDKEYNKFTTEEETNKNNFQKVAMPR